MNPLVRMQLSVMMFLQFFLWGAWYVTAPNYLGTIGFTGADFGWTYSVGPIAGMIAPFFVGMVADRFFAAQWVLGVLHLLGAALMGVALGLMRQETPDPNMINLAFFGHMLCYFPTLALTNTIAMRNMTNPEKEFPGIRVLGTVGWIIAGLALSWLGWSGSQNMFQLAIGAGIVLGLFSFALPHTPPTKGGVVTVRQILGLDALVLLKDGSYLVFLVCSVLICIPLAFYYQIASRVVEMMQFDKVEGFTDVAKSIGLGDAVGLTMTFGQMSEIFFMLIMPLCFARLGVKWMLAVGMLAWVTRYALFALGAPTEVKWMILLGVILHGICYDFFFVTGQIFTDQKAPKELRGQAQGLLVLFTLGIGMAIGAQIAGRIEARCTPKVSVAVERVFPDQAGAIRDLEAKVDAATGDAQADAAKSLDDAIKGMLADASDDQKKEFNLAKLRVIDWKTLWGIPAIFAGVILVIFVLLFRQPPPAEPAQAS